MKDEGGEGALYRIVGFILYRKTNERWRKEGLYIEQWAPYRMRVCALCIECRVRRSIYRSVEIEALVKNRLYIKYRVRGSIRFVRRGALYRKTLYRCVITYLSCFCISLLFSAVNSITFSFESLGVCVCEREQEKERKKENEKK